MEPSSIRVQERWKMQGKIDKVVYKSDKNNKKRLALSTRSTYIKVLKGFFVWLKKKKCPEETDWITPPAYQPNKLRTEDKITWEDVEKLSKAATNRMELLLPQLLFDSGARIEELLTLRLKDCEITTLNKESPGEKPELAALIHIRVSKTETRSPMVYRSVPALRDWMDNHPLRAMMGQEAPLFVCMEQNHNPLSYKEARAKLLKLKKRAGLKHKGAFHLFRKSACSLCGDMGMGDSQIDKRFGGADREQSQTILSIPRGV
jgi:integrase